MALQEMSVFNLQMGFAAIHLSRIIDFMHNMNMNIAIFNKDNVCIRYVFNGINFMTKIGISAQSYHRVIVYFCDKPHIDWWVREKAGFYSVYLEINFIPWVRAADSLLWNNSGFQEQRMGCMLAAKINKFDQIFINDYSEF